METTSTWVCALATLTVLTTTTFAQKPVITSHVFISREPAPASLAALTNSADLIVLGSIMESHNVVTTDQGYAYAKTESSLIVSQVIKTSRNVTVGSVLSIVREGGEIDQGYRIIRSVDPMFAAFQNGETYMLYLFLNGALGKYQVRSGPDGAFRLANGQIEAMGGSALSKQLNRQPLEAVRRAVLAAPR
jgi:hypothetical protein